MVPMLKRIQQICSLHNKRGERIAELNLPPSVMHAFPDRVYRYRDQLIPIVSRGWISIGGAEVHSVETIGGPIFTYAFTYTLQQ